MSSPKLKVLTTKRDKRAILYNNYCYRQIRLLKSNDVSWRCVVKECNAYLKTDDKVLNVVDSRGTHAHPEMNEHQQEKKEVNH